MARMAKIARSFLWWRRKTANGMDLPLRCGVANPAGPGVVQFGPGALPRGGVLQTVRASPPLDRPGYASYLNGAADRPDGPRPPVYQEPATKTNRNQNRGARPVARRPSSQ